MSEQMRNIGDFISTVALPHILFGVILFTVSIYTVLRSFRGYVQNNTEKDDQTFTAALVIGKHGYL